MKTSTNKPKNKKQFFALETNDLMHELLAENNRLLIELKASKQLMKIMNQLMDYLEDNCLRCCQQCQQNLQFTEKVAKYRFHICTVEQKLVKVCAKTSDGSYSSAAKKFKILSNRETIDKQLLHQYKGKQEDSNFDRLFTSVFDDQSFDLTTDILIDDNMIINSDRNRQLNNTTGDDNQSDESKDWDYKPTDDINRHEMDNMFDDKTVGIKIGKNQFNCDYCGKQYSHRWLVATHINKVHLKVKPFVCNLCEKAFAGDRNLFYHRKKCRIKPKDPSITLIEGVAYHLCDWEDCQFKSKQKTALIIHKKRHMGRRDYQCCWPACEERFYTNEHLKYHMLKHENKVPVYDCPQCGAKVKHLAKHKSRAHKLIEAIHKCLWPGCDKILTSKEKLGRHMMIHEERRYVCNWPECGRKFVQNQQLKRHYLIHTGDKPFKCRFCGKAFNQLCNMKTHETKHDVPIDDALNAQVVNNDS
ncbi:zinc finger protein 845-like [Oppia nitens]|uniref:zinc finger protein 845-like n=1 Tax=Oppia nitens TaxID=1686743 RepID=UPI0023DBE483|nr:zinc finger protein 845-like [Oppia nitens]